MKRYRDVAVVLLILAFLNMLTFDFGGWLLGIILLFTAYVLWIESLS